MRVPATLLFFILPVGCERQASDDPGEVASAVKAAHEGVEVPIVFVSRAPQPDGSAAWPSAQGGPLELPGTGPRSRLRPARGSKLLVREPDGSLRPLVDGSKPTAASLHLVDVNAPAVSYDGKLVAFAGLPEGPHVDAPHSPRNGTPSVGGWRIYIIGADGTGLRQLTRDDPKRKLSEYVQQFGEAAGGALFPFDDFDPVFLPTGNLAFSSTRWPAFAHQGDTRASQLYVIESDGDGLRRITTERNGADRAVIDPLTGELVYARWWSNARFPANTTATVQGPEPDTYVTHLGFKTDPDPRADEAPPVFVDGTLPRVAWHAAHIRPDGYGLGMFSGHLRSEPLTHYYGGTFTDDGVLYANWYPAVDMVSAAGFGGIVRRERGSAAPTPVVGAAPGGGVGAPKQGELKGVYATDPVVLPGPDGKRMGPLLVSLTTTPGDPKQDYGLYVLQPDGRPPKKLIDLPGTAELRAQVLAPRGMPMRLIDIATGHAWPLPPPAVALAPSAEEMAILNRNGVFGFHPLNVYANAPVDVDIVSAMPIGSAKTIAGYADYQRQHPGSAGGHDWPIIVGATAIDPGGAAEMTAPANVPLFETIRDGQGNVPRTGGHYGALRGTEGAAHVAGLNYAPPGFDSRCVGCHAGHTMIPVPKDDDAAKWTNLAPGAAVTLSSVADPALKSAMEEAVVDRRVRTAPDPARQWRAAGSADEWATLTFPVPIWVHEVRLYGPVPGDGTDAVIDRATIRLFADAEAKAPLGEVGVEKVAAEGTPAMVRQLAQPVGVRVVQVRIDAAHGDLLGKPGVGLAEVEVIARGDPPRPGSLPAPELETKINALDYEVLKAARESYAAPAQPPKPKAVARAPLGECAGAGVRFGAGALPLPGDERAMRVAMQAMQRDADGAVRFDPNRTYDFPVYAMVLEGACEVEPCTWRSVGVERDLPRRSNLFFRVRTGDTPIPDDEEWGSWTDDAEGTELLLDPPLKGRYLEVVFQFVAANRREGPALWGLRACH